jgi:hypothetical protein
MRSLLYSLQSYLDLRQDTKDFLAIRARELVVQMALTFINYILQQGLMSVREDRSYNFKTVKNDFIIELGDMLGLYSNLKRFLL